MIDKDDITSVNCSEAVEKIPNKDKIKVNANDPWVL